MLFKCYFRYSGFVATKLFYFYYSVLYYVAIDIILYIITFIVSIILLEKGRETSSTCEDGGIRENLGNSLCSRDKI